MFLVTSNHALKKKKKFHCELLPSLCKFVREINLTQFWKSAGNCIKNYFSMKSDLSDRDPAGAGGNQVCRFISA